MTELSEKEQHRQWTAEAVAWMMESKNNHAIDAVGDQFRVRGDGIINLFERHGPSVSKNWHSCACYIKYLRIPPKEVKRIPITCVADMVKFQDIFAIDPIEPTQQLIRKGLYWDKDHIGFVNTCLANGYEVWGEE